MKLMYNILDLDFGPSVCVHHRCLSDTVTGTNVVATINTIIGPSEVCAPAVGVAHAGGERSGLY